MRSTRTVRRSVVRHVCVYARGHRLSLAKLARYKRFHGKALRRVVNEKTFSIDAFDVDRATITRFARRTRHVAKTRPLFPVDSLIALSATRSPSPNFFAPLPQPLCARSRFSSLFFPFLFLSPARCQRLDENGALFRLALLFSFVSRVA